MITSIIITNTEKPAKKQSKTDTRVNEGVSSDTPSFTLVFFSCGHAAANVALGLVYIQKLAYLGIQRGINRAESFGNVLMNRALGNAELLCGGTDGAAVFYDVNRQLTGSLFDVCMHIYHSP